MTERKLDRRVEVVDKAEAVLVKLDEGEAYLLEALAVLQASSVTTWTRMAQVKTRC